MTNLPSVNPPPAVPAASAAASVAPASGAGSVVIKCAGVNKVFKDFWMRPRVKAVVDVNLDVLRGEVFGLLGPNGSGKSTTIKLILGLLHPTSGRIAVFGKRPDDVATKELIGYLPEESYLYRFLNARETLDYYGRLFHLPRHTRQKRIDMLLEMVGLDAAQHRPVGEYSKGMQRRIGLAQALINQPQLLILDEPTTGMDPIGTRQMKDLIRRLKDRGITILLCSHLLADVEDVCDRVTIMFGGRVVEEGTIDELLVQRDSTTIESQQLDEQTIQQVDEVLARHGKHIERVSTRRQTLEKKFLELVERERTRGTATSGAQSGGAIADFLLEAEERGGHLPEDAEAAAVLNELTRPAPLTPVAPPADAPAAPAEPPARAQPQVDAALLEQLSGQSSHKPKSPPRDAGQGSAPASASPSTKAAPEPQRAPEADLSVLAGLVAPAAPAPKSTPAKPPAAPASETKPERPAPATPAPPDSAPSVAKGPAGPPASAGDRSADERASKPTPESASNPAPDPASEQASQAPLKSSPKPASEPPPRPLVSKESGESGLGLTDGMSADDEELPLPPVDPPKPAQSPSKSSELPDASFLRALEDVEPEEEKP